MEQEETKRLEKGLKENSEEINDVLKGCENHVPKEGSRYFDGNKAIEICRKCGVSYETQPTQKEISDWNYLVREEKFY